MCYGLRGACCALRGTGCERRVIRFRVLDCGFGIVSIGDDLDLRYGTGDLYIKGGRFRDWG